MCGRFARYEPPSAWLEPLGLPPDDDLLRRTGTPRYNIAPGTQTLIAAPGSGGEPEVGERLWAFPTRRGNRINVRSETAHRVPEYRRHFDRQRCLVFASGFYEPKGAKTVKNRPWYFFRPRDGGPLFLGGIVKADGFSILTAAPDNPVAAVHDRSPVMIAPDNLRAWLDPEVPGREALQQCASTHIGKMLKGWHVGDAAKNPRNEGAELIAGVQDELF